MLRISCHVQAWTPGAFEFAMRLGGPVLKVMTPEVEPVAKILERHPQTQVIVRKYYSLEEQDIRRQARHAGGSRVAFEVAEHFGDLIVWCRNHRVPVWAEGLNETGLWNDAYDYNAFTVAFAQACSEVGLRPLAYSFPVGNPPEFGHWKHYEDGLRACRDAGGGLALHQYGWPDVRKDADWLSCRHRKVREVLPDDLKHIPLLVTETGLDRGSDPREQKPPHERPEDWAGWTNAGINPDQYAEQLVWLDAQYNADDVLCGTIFTVGGFWPSFDVSHVPEIADALREAAASHPAPPIPESETPVQVVTALLVAALALVPGPQRTPSKPAVWHQWERVVRETATLSPHLSPEDVVTIALGPLAAISQESEGNVDAKGDQRPDGYFCSRGLLQLNTCGGVGSAIMRKHGLTNPDDLYDLRYQYEHAQTLILAVEAELYWSRQEKRPFNPGKAIQSVQRSSSDPTGAGYQAAYDTLRREATPLEGDMPTATIGNLTVTDLRGRYPSTYSRRPLSAITSIAVHHSATDTLPATTTEAEELAALDSIHRYHETVYGGIAYSNVVMPSGRCYLTGDWDTVRYHAGGQNNVTSLSVLLHGDFSDTPPGDAQLDAAHRLIANIRYQMGNATLPVVGHRDLSSTQCPGSGWDIWKHRLVGTNMPVEPVDARSRAHKELDSLWAYAQALRMNGDNDNAEFVEGRVIAIKQEVG